MNKNMHCSVVCTVKKLEIVKTDRKTQVRYSILTVKSENERTAATTTNINVSCKHNSSDLKNKTLKKTYRTNHLHKSQNSEN